MVVLTEAPVELETIPTISKEEEVLLKAEELLRTEGWCRGIRKNELGEYCAVGALEQAIFGEVHYVGGDKKRHLFTRLYNLCNTTLQANSVSLMAYNDHKARTKEDIISVFEEARALIRQGGIN